MSKVAKPLSAPHLGAIVKALEEIEAHFACEGFSNRPGFANGSPDDDDDDDDDADDEEQDDSERAPEVFDAEEIEIAIDCFLSKLIKAEIVKKPKTGAAPSMRSTFKEIFGQGHEIVEKVTEFEHLVAGYFGWVSIDDMQQAHRQLLAIKQTLQVELGGSRG